MLMSVRDFLLCSTSHLKLSSCHILHVTYQKCLVKIGRYQPCSFLTRSWTMQNITWPISRHLDLTVNKSHVHVYKINVQYLIHCIQKRTSVSFVNEPDTHIITQIEPGLRCFGFTVHAASLLSSNR